MLLVKGGQCRLGLLLVLCGAVGHRIGHDAELAQEDLPQEQVDPRVQDLVEGGHADRKQEKVTVQRDVVGGRRGGGQSRGIALLGGDLGGDHPQHQTLRGRGDTHSQRSDPNKIYKNK